MTAKKRIWTLPDRPDHPRYIRLAKLLKELRGKRRQTLLRHVVERDFWAFVWLVSSFGQYRIDEPGHPRDGSLWVMDPYVFERCREAQADFDNNEDHVAYIHPRFTFKTTIFTVNRSLWILLKYPSRTICLITQKVDKAGDAMFNGFKDELEGNAAYHLLAPDIFPAAAKDYPAFSDKAITVLRPAGTREPSLSIHPATRLPTGTHYDEVVIDDLVTEEVVTKLEHMVKVEGQRESSTALGKSNTRTIDVGTIWAANDPNEKWIKARRFSRVSLIRAFVLPKGQRWTATTETTNLMPVCHGREFWEKWRKKLGPYRFACLGMASPIPRSEQSFDPVWRKLTPNTPSREWNPRTAARYMIIDPAGTERGAPGKDDNDYWIWRVVDLGADRRVRGVDLWRERCNFQTVLDLTFALVRYWRPKVVWCEEFGAQNVINPMRREMEARSFQFDLRKLPDIKTDKTRRIQQLQVAYAAGRIIEPESDYDHGSGPKYIDKMRVAAGDLLPRPPSSQVHDERNTGEQVYEDEYLNWTPSHGTKGKDDGLDTLAWIVQPQMKSRLTWPEVIGRPAYRDDETLVRLNKAAIIRLDDDEGSSRGRTWYVS